ncbi:MAG TPA: molybdopterin-dependent oxidoreductase [Bryobacteraceae bacterium]|nr:molybdopterin-dependent oxidoreductase [Bryobacteraceae bacterium]
MLLSARVFVVSVVATGLTFAQSGPSQISITGDIPTPVTIRAEDLASMPREKVKVPEPDGKEVEYEGVPLREILKRAGAPMGSLRGKALTTYVLARAHDGYAAVFTLGEVDTEFGNEPIIVADKRDGKPLAGNLGPLRLECPRDKAGARSVRMLESLEIVRLVK